MATACGRMFAALVAAAMLSCCATSRLARNERVHVILVGDSTMARVTGYGDALCARFDALTRCDNLARGGRSSKSYRAEGLWNDALAHAREPGYATTYVLIQFGHNDQPGKAERSTTLSEFSSNMRRYADEVRADGAVPVLITPLTRRSFRSGKLVDGLGPWADATATVARASATALLDLHRDSMTTVATMGAVEALSLAELPPPQSSVAAAGTGTTIEVAKPEKTPLDIHVPAFDYTHLGVKGAALFSGTVATEIAGAVPDLARHLK